MALTADVSTQAEKLGMRILSLLDLTSLGNRDAVEAEAIKKLLIEARQAPVLPATFCTWPEFLPLITHSNQESGISITPCAVVDFPYGRGTPDSVRNETFIALANNAKEIDIVMDYESMMRGNFRAVEEKLKAARDTVPARNVLKVILETAAILPDTRMLREAELLAIDCGADFLKTSTGKHERGGASVEAVRSMLEAASEHEGRIVGVKASGGIRTIAQADAYIAMADKAYGREANKNLMRIGASRGLLDEVMFVLDGPSEHEGQRPGRNRQAVPGY